MILSPLRRVMYSPSIYTNTNDLHNDDKSVLYQLNRTGSFICLYVQPTGIIPLLNRRFSIHEDGLLIRSTRKDDGVFTPFETVSEISREGEVVLLRRENEKDLRIQISEDTSGETFVNLLSRSYDKFLQ